MTSVIFNKKTFTWNSRGSLDIFPIEMLDDGLTFLCRLHPIGRGKNYVFNSRDQEIVPALATRGLTPHTYY